MLHDETGQELVLTFPTQSTPKYYGTPGGSTVDTLVSEGIYTNNPYTIDRHQGMK